jgi:hypothetical protein
MPIDAMSVGRRVVACVAVVCAADGVRHVETGATPGAVLARLAAYVRRHASDRLWPADARHVGRLLARGRVEAAVRHYFAAPARWDEEWLLWGPGDAPGGVAV